MALNYIIYTFGYTHMWVFDIRMYILLPQHIVTGMKVGSLHTTRTVVQLRHFVEKVLQVVSRFFIYYIFDIFCMIYSITLLAVRLNFRNGRNKSGVNMKEIVKL